MWCTSTKKRRHGPGWAEETKLRIEGFDLDVAIEDGRPRVRVCLANGECVIDTARVSVQGLERMSDVFTAASRMARRGMDRWWEGWHNRVEHRGRHVNLAPAALDTASFPEWVRTLLAKRMVPGELELLLPLTQNPAVLHNGHLVFEPELDLDRACLLADAYAALNALEWSADTPGWYSDMSVRVEFWPLKEFIIRD